MKIIFSLSLLLLASSDCFSMKKRQLGDNNNLENNQPNHIQFFQTNEHVIPLKDKGQKRYSTEENNQPNHIQFNQNNSYIDIETQKKFRQLEQQQKFINNKKEQNEKLQFITILQMDGTCRTVYILPN